jgi:hypothetical protein
VSGKPLDLKRQVLIGGGVAIQHAHDVGQALGNGRASSRDDSGSDRWHQWLQVRRIGWPVTSRKYAVEG